MKILCTNEKIESCKQECIAVPFRKSGNNRAYEELCKLTRRELASHVNDVKFKAAISSIQSGI